MRDQAVTMSLAHGQVAAIFSCLRRPPGQAADGVQEPTAMNSQG
jgi:hypothetical protein